MKKDPIRPYLIASAIAGIPFIFICLTAMTTVRLEKYQCGQNYLFLHNLNSHYEQ